MNSWKATMGKTNPQVINKGCPVSFVLQESVNRSIRNQDCIRCTATHIIFMKVIRGNGYSKLPNIYIPFVHKKAPILVF